MTHLKELAKTMLCCCLAIGTAAPIQAENSQKDITWLRALELKDRLLIVDAHSHDLFKPDSPRWPKQINLSLMEKGGLKGLVQNLPLGTGKAEDPVGMILANIHLNILYEKEFQLPKMSILYPVGYTALFDSIEEVKKHYFYLKKNLHDAYVFDSEQLNIMGMVLMQFGALENIPGVLKLNIEEYPDNFSAYYELGKFYCDVEKKYDLAEEYLKKALERSDSETKEEIRNKLFEVEAETDEDEQNYMSFHKIEKAWSVSKGNGVKVAVLDWLFDMSPQASEKYIDPISLVPGQEVGSSEPWHGEWMAEIIHRIAPEAKIIPIRARPPKDEKSGKDSEEQPYERYLIEGIRYAADHGAVAVTNSMGPVKHTEELLEAVKYAEKKGTVFIDVHPEYVEKKNGSYVFCDSSQCNPLIIHTGIVSVPKYQMEPESNRDIYTWPFDIDPKFRDGWGFSNGPPIVAGVIALMKSVNPALSVKEMKDILTRTCDMKDGFKVLNAERALKESRKITLERNIRGKHTSDQADESLFSFEPDIRLFLVFAFMNAAGYDFDYAKDHDPVRQEIRSHLKTVLDDDFRNRIAEYYSQYLRDYNHMGWGAFALYLSAPPELEIINDKGSFRITDELKNTLPLFREFYDKAKVEELWRKYYPILKKNNYAFKPFADLALQQIKNIGICFSAELAEEAS